MYTHKILLHKLSSLIVIQKKLNMWLYLIAGGLVIIYYLIKSNCTYWEKLGIPGPKPLPVVGNTGANAIGKISISEIFRDVYMKYSDYPFVGAYRSGTPCLILRDPDVIKTIMVKDFKYFMDNDIFVNKETDPLMGRNPFVLKGEEWKKARQQLTPSFTAGKMKGMFPVLENVSKKMIKYLEDLTTLDGLDVKEICTKFTCDNVAVCAFGLEGKCFEEPNSEFRELAEKFISTDSWQGFRFAMSVIIPKLSHFLSMKLVPKYVEDKLIDVVKGTLKFREEQNIKLNDFLESVSQLTKTDPSYTIVDVTAHASTFFLDGFETSAISMAYLLFELAMNEEYQVKLREEVKSVLGKHNGQLSYEALQEMEYLDACVNESLRKYPPLASLGKICTESYTLNATSDDYKKLSVRLEPGNSIIVPVLGLHMDPKYFPNPEKFIPDRFLDKENTYKYIYMPFGEGPRICLGQRFGLLQVKIGVAQLVKNFKIEVNRKTQIPLKYLPFYLLFYPRGGIWLNFHKI